MTDQRTETDSSANPTTAAPEMDDTGTDWSNTGGPADTNTGWTSGRWSGANASASAQTWLTQLQSIIDNLATQSAPVIREVGAKAAEIAALAADRAGPLAQRAAEATAQASIRVAERSRTIAADLRRPPEGPSGQAEGSGPADEGGSPINADTAEDSAAPTGPTV